MCEERVLTVPPFGPIDLSIIAAARARAATIVKLASSGCAHRCQPPITPFIRPLDDS